MAASDCLFRSDGDGCVCISDYLCLGQLRCSYLDEDGESYYRISRSYKRSPEDGNGSVGKARPSPTLP